MFPSAFYRELRFAIWLFTPRTAMNTCALAQGVNKISAESLPKETVSQSLFVIASPSSTSG